MNFIQLDKRQLCDLELILNNAFKPLNGFMNKDDYQNCLTNMRLADNTLWPMPIVLPISHDDVDKFKHYESIILKDETGMNIASMDISQENSIYKYNLEEEAKAIFGIFDDNHPYIKIMKKQYDSGKVYYCGGKITQINPIKHFDFKDYRLSPEQTKQYFKDNTWNKVIGFQTRNPMHRSHYELTKYALNKAGDNSRLLLHPVVGVTQDCDVDYYTRVKCYLQILQHYPENTIKLSLLPLSMRMAGPREAVWHAIIRKNYGCTHFVVGRDHAGPSYKRKDGKDFFGHYDAQNLLLEHKDEIGINVIISKLIVYATHKETNESLYSPIDLLDTEKYNIQKLSGTQQREMLNNGTPLPEWFTYPSVYNELIKEYKPLNQRGLCLYFVGLSGSGKTTLAKAIIPKLNELLNKKITYLDGDIVRKNLSKGLGFSKEDRSTNVRRIGYVASQVVRHNGLAVVANIAPYLEDRKVNRQIISNEGNYVQIWVKTPLEKCEERDVKGLYKLAREGKIKEFTGISDPFETPDDSELTLDGTSDLEELTLTIIKYLKNKNYV